MRITITIIIVTGNQNKIHYICRWLCMQMQRNQNKIHYTCRSLCMQMQIDIQRKIFNCSLTEQNQDYGRKYLPVEALSRF